MEIFVYGVLIVLLFIFLIYPFEKRILNSKITLDKPKNNLELKRVRLYSQDGVLIKSYENVYMEHWDKYIYHVYDKGSNLIARIDKGANMLLISENISIDIKLNELET